MRWISTKIIFLFIILALIAPAQAEEVLVNDVTKLNPTVVQEVLAPENTPEVQKIVRDHPGPISIGGGRYSMGGQTATNNTVFIDMRAMNHVVHFSKENKEITVEAGITWKKLQDYIDPYNLSVKIMQTYHNFTVGGSLSVNAHGRTTGMGPLILSVRSIKLVLADGTLVEANPTENAELFYGAIGGYGGLGVIVEATLSLTDNVNIERQAALVPINEYKNYFLEQIRNNPKAVFHNGDIYPPTFKNVNAVTWLSTDKPLTDENHFKPIKSYYWIENIMYFWITELPYGSWFREHVLEPYLYKHPAVVKRNYEASYDVKELEPPSRLFSTYVLQEYFIPVDKFDDFVPKMRDIFLQHHAKIVNVSIRHAYQDPGSLMAWARQEVFAFVVYYKQGTGPEARQEVGNWTRELIDAALAENGSYYLPYQPLATQAQFRAAYPHADQFFALKQKVDPTNKFRNKLWDKYYHPNAEEQKIWDEKDSIKNYDRSEAQTYLTLPEWYIVFSSAEYAKSLNEIPPSAFPYFGSIKQFWHIYRTVAKKSAAEYPFNFGYNLMINVIGVSYSTEYALKGVYENTIGRLTEMASDREALTENMKVEGYIQKVGADYTVFVAERPWYEYPFYQRFKEFWKIEDGPGTSAVRRYERRFFFSTELLLKSGYGAAIAYATHAIYQPEDLYIGAVVIQDGQMKIVSLPRYQSFTEQIPKLTRQGTKFVEIAGNDKIAMTVIVPIGWQGTEMVDAFDLWPILTAPGFERVAVTVPVKSLGSFIGYLDKNKFLVDHIFDY